jgi:transcriptional repressor NrdR
LNCPYCKASASKVIDSRDAGSSIRRRRTCESCGERFTTHERVEQRFPYVSKKGGRRQPFDRSRVLSGLELACRKRPVDADSLEAATERISQRVISLGGGDIDTKVIGELVLDELLRLDRVAYLRFASVYQETATPEGFMALLKPLMSEGSNE